MRAVQRDRSDGVRMAKKETNQRPRERDEEMPYGEVHDHMDFSMDGQAEMRG